MDFRRLNDVRPGYGYAGLPDPHRDELAPKDAGIWRVDLATGKDELILSLADVALGRASRPTTGRGRSTGSTTCWSTPTAAGSSSCTAGGRPASTRAFRTRMLTADARRQGPVRRRSVGAHVALHLARPDAPAGLDPAGVASPRASTCSPTRRTRWSRSARG